METDDIHFPTGAEVIDLIHKSGFELVEDAWLSDIATKTETVKEWISNCRFWAVEKI
ncbi:MAG TPA: hypothetical protein VHY08_27670 [Bacillota bacterium]|nr:hypothetical protein [Bacillota bacterium]